MAIHGIRPADVADAPTWTSALADILAFSDGQPLVAHNAGFDMGVIRAACTAEGIPWPDIRYTCSQVISRRTWKLLSYSLPYCTDAAGVVFTNHHDAGADATAAAEVLLSALQTAGTDSLDDLLSGHRIRWGGMTSDGTWQGSTYRGRNSTKAPLPEANPDADPDGPLYGMTVVLTGTLTSMTRHEAFARLAKAGARPAAAVTKKTDVLVSATQRIRPGDALSGKARRAQELLASGHDIEVLDEDEFLRRLSA